MAYQHPAGEGSPTVFLVEANTEGRAHLQKLLASHPCSISAFASATEALNELENANTLPGLIICGLQGPGMNGWRLCRLLRSPAGTRFNKTPILALTPAAGDAYADNLAVILNIEAVLPLPLDEIRFQDKVQALLRGEIRRKPARVLIVEDDRGQAQALEDTFIQYGFRVASTPSIRTAASLFEITPFNLLLVDDNVADGADDTLIETLQAKHADCICVLMTGEPSSEVEWQRLANGKAEYVRKPCTGEMLAERYYQVQRERYLQRQGVLPMEAQPSTPPETSAAEAALPAVGGGAVEGNIPDFNLANILDSRSLQSLMDDFYELTHIGIAILDLEGNILVANGWQTICTQFHRTNPESAVNCLESDTILTQNVRPGMVNIYRCKNGMLDVSTPIMLGEQHKGNIFYGQFFFDDDPPDEDVFRRQARLYGFNEEAYIKALHDVPRWSRTALDTIMSFYTKLAGIVSSVNYKNYQLSQIISEKTQLLQDLKESEERFSLAMEATNDGIWDGNVLTRQVYYSPNYWRMLGYETEEFQGDYDDWANLIHPEDRVRVIQANQDCIENRIQSYEVEYRLQTKDGNWKWILDRGNVVRRDADGRALRMIGTHMDISERIQAAETFQRTEARYRALIDQALDGVVLINRQGSFEYASPTARKMFGYSEGEDLNLNPNDATHPEDRPRVLAALQDIMQRHRANVRLQYRFLQKDGSWRWIESSFTNLLAEPGVEAIVINFHDIHEQRQVEEALRQRDKIFTHAQDMLCVAGLDGYYKVLNPAWTRTLKWTTDELMARPWLEFVHPDDRERTLKIGAIQSTGTIVNQFENRYICKDGTIKWLSWNTYPYPDEELIIATARDISEHKKVVAALSESEERYRLLFSQMAEGFALHEIICDDAGEPVDYKFLDVNPAFEKQTGLNRADLIGRPVTEAIPGTESYWIRTYGEVALTGKTIHYENYAESLGRWFFVTAFCPKPGQFAVTFSDITERKRAEEVIEKKIIALTQPIDDATGINFEDLFNLDDIQRLQDKFAAATGVASIITHPDGTPITAPSNFCRLCSELIRNTEKGRMNCFKPNAEIGRYSSGGANIQPCLSGGLWDAGAGISVGGKHLANWLIGQVRDETQNEDKMSHYADEIGIERRIFLEAFHEVPAMSQERFNEVAEMLYTFASQLSTAAYQNVQQARFITERKTAIEKLEKSEERLRLTLEASQIGIWDWDILNDQWYVSPSYYSMLGYEPKTGSGDRDEWTERLHPDDRDFVSMKIRNVLVNGVSNYQYEARVLHADGTYRWLYVIGFSIERDDEGKISRMLGIRMDINDRKRAEEALKISEERFRSFVENANDIVYQLTPDGVFEYVSPVWTNSLGHAVDEVEGNSFEIFVHPDDLPVCRSYLDKIIHSEEVPRAADYRVKHKNGEWRWHTSNGAAVRDISGKVIGFIGIARDITERKSDEARLNEQLEELRRWNAATLGRETRILELKKEVNQILTEEGKTIRYASAQEIRMIEPSFLGLVHNAALLLALVLIFDVTAAQWRTGQIGFKQIPFGILLGAIGMVLMLTPWVYTPGIIFDTRSILLGISGLFFGFVPTVIAMAMTALLRYSQGGAAMPTGVSVILATGTLGIIWRHLRKGDLAEISWRELYGFGVLIHLVMLALFFLLPWETALQVLANISLTVLVIYPLGTALLGKLMMTRLHRERIESSLAESEARYRAIFQSNHAVMLLIDPQSGVIMDANPAACAYYGYSLAEIKRMQISQINTLTEADVQDELRKAVLEQRNHFIFQHRLASGDLRNVEVFSGPITVGGKSFIYSIIHDITERKLAESALQESEERLRLAVESANIGFFFWDLASNRVHYTLEWKKQIGYGDEEISDRFEEWQSRVHPEDLPASQERVDACLKNLQEDYETEFRFRHKDGSYRWILVRGKLLLDAKGQAHRLLGCHIDVTEMKRIEEQILTSERRFRSLAESSTDFIMLFDRDYRHVYLNPAALRASGKSEADILGKTLQEADIPDGVAESWETDIAFVFAQAAPTQHLAEVDAPNGKITYDWRASPVFGSDGSVELVLASSRDITAIKQAELALKKSEAQYRMLTESMRDVVWVLDTETLKFTFVSSSVEKLRGYTAEEVMSRPMDDALTPEAAAGLKALIRERVQDLLSGRTPVDQYYVNEVEQPCKDGTTVWTEVITGYFLDPETGKVELRGVTRDLRERRQAEKALREEKVFSDAILESVPGVLYLYDAEGHLLRWNKKHEEMTGYSAEELDHFNLLDWYKDEPEDIERVMKGVQKALDEGFGSAEANLIKKDGTATLFDFTAVRIDIEDKVYFTGIGIDITERRRAEQALQASEAKFRQIFETSAVGISIMDLDGNFTSGNPAILKMLDYSAEEYSHLTLRDISHPDDAEKDLSLYQELLDGTRASYSIEKRNLRKNGGFVWGRLTCTMVRDPNGCPQFSIGMFMDITEHKKVEEQIQEAQAELERLLAEADQSRRVLLSVVEDQKLAEEQIRSLNAELEQRVTERTALLEAANQELEAFAYSVSHDLRSPLRALDGFSDALLTDYNDVLDDSGRDYLARIRAASRRMGQLINDLLNLSRVTRTDFVRQQVNLSHLAQEIAVDIIRQNNDRRVEFDISPGIVVDGDLHLLRIVLDNLLNNAFKFTSQCETARITVGSMEQDGERVYFVKDNGAGFDMTYASKLFAPFQRLHGAQEYPGTGIGLVTVKRIVTRHGGRIWPEAAVNQGAAFYFTLGSL